jgi:plastocyanin
MSKILISAVISIFSFAAIFLTACGGPAKSAADSNAPVVADGSIPAAVDNDRAKAFRVDYKSEPGQIQAGTPATLLLTVMDRQGAIVKDLQIVHEKPMHLLIVSRDLAEFYHVHPEQSADGSYRVRHTFPNGGDYRLYADFTPKEATQVVEPIDVKVAGQEERAERQLVADTDFTKTVNGLKVVMKPAGELRAGSEVMLNFQAFDAGTGKPATDLENYLGELAHFVIISEDMKDFVHAHPMSKSEKMDGMKMDANSGGDHNADGHRHSTSDGTTAIARQSEVAAHTSFPRPGLYKIWAQFQRRGEIITAAFVVNAGGEAQKTVSQKTADVPPDAIRVNVTESGYEPASISVKKGQSVKLAFYRAGEEGCGDELVFPKLNIRKKLPVGETVLVEFTPPEAGDIQFSCGMDMLRGKVVVSES